MARFGYYVLAAIVLGVIVVATFIFVTKQYSIVHLGPNPQENPIATWSDPLDRDRVVQIQPNSIGGDCPSIMSRPAEMSEWLRSRHLKISVSEIQALGTLYGPNVKIVRFLGKVRNCSGVDLFIRLDPIALASKCSDVQETFVTHPVIRQDDVREPLRPTVPKMIPAGTVGDVELMVACHFDVTLSHATVNLSLSLSDLDKRRAATEFSIADVPIQRIYEQRQTENPFGQNR
jgi:hypothetical protein